MWVLVAALASLADPPSALWDDVARPNRLRCARLVEEGRRLSDARTAVEAARALEVLDEAARLCPRDLEALALLGQAQVRSGQWATGRAALERARALAPAGDDRDPRLAFYLALARAHDGDLEGSLVEYRRAERIGGLGRETWLLHYDLGDTLMALGRLEEAIDSYRRAIKAAPATEAISRFALAVALDRDGQVERSRAELRMAVAIDRRLTCLEDARYFFVPPADQHYYLALAYRALGRAAEARAKLEAFLRELPDGPYAFRARELLLSWPVR